MKMIITTLLLILYLPSHAADCPVWSREEAQKNMTRLTDEIADHNDLYFNKDAPVISDEEYDALVARLKDWQACFPHIKIAAQPPEVPPANDAITHQARMGSLKKADSDEDIATFFKKTLNGEALLQPKIDGVAVELVYENGQLVKAATRGNGEHGTDILHIIRQMPLIPNTLILNKVRNNINDQKLIFHGELFTRLDKAAPSLLKSYTSARHLVAGQLNRLIPDKQLLSFIDFFPWRWVNSPYSSDIESIRALALLGFKRPLEYTHPVQSLNEIRQYLDEYSNHKKAPFLMDGIVIKANDLTLRKQLGWQSGTPAWAMAWKFPPASGISEVNDIEFTIGRTGNITPVLHIEPVTIQNETITRVSLGSVGNLQKKDIAIGDHISVVLKGRATPVFGKVLFRPEQRTFLARPDSNRYTPFSCLSMSAGCEQQFITRLIWLTGKQGLDLPINRNIIRGLVLSEKIKTLVDILQLDQKSLTAAGMSTTGSQHYLKSMNEPKTLEQQLRAISLPGVGALKARKLMRCINRLDGLLSKSIGSLAMCFDGAKSAQAVIAYLERSEIRVLIEYIERSVPTQSVGTRLSE